MQFNTKLSLTNLQNKVDRENGGRCKIRTYNLFLNREQKNLLLDVLIKRHFLSALTSWAKRPKMNGGYYWVWTSDLEVNSFSLLPTELNTHNNEFGHGGRIRTYDTRIPNILINVSLFLL